MNDDKVSKKNFWKNLVVFGVLLLIIFSVNILNISIGFTVFEDIENIPLFMIISIILIVIIIIIVVIVLVFVYKIKNKEIGE